MRNRQPPKQEQAQAIDLTPMLDVVFIMLIFFIVTATFIKLPGVEVSRTEAMSAEQRNAAILVAISGNNEIWIDNSQVERDQVKLELTRLRQESPKGGLVIQADNESSVETVGFVSDQAIDIGISNIAVSTLEE